MRVPHLLTAVAFGQVKSRGVRDLAFRELVSLVSIATIDAAVQLRPHVADAFRAGNTRQSVAAILVQAMPCVGGRYVLTRRPRNALVV